MRYLALRLSQVGKPLMTSAFSDFNSGGRRTGILRSTFGSMGTASNGTTQVRATDAVSERPAFGGTIMFLLRNGSLWRIESSNDLS